MTAELLTAGKLTKGSRDNREPTQGQLLVQWQAAIAEQKKQFEKQFPNSRVKYIPGKKGKRGSWQIKGLGKQEPQPEIEQ